MDLALNYKKYPQSSRLEKAIFLSKNFMINSLIMKLLSNKKILATFPQLLPRMFNSLEEEEGITQIEEVSSKETTTTGINLLIRGRSSFLSHLQQTFLL